MTLPPHEAQACDLVWRNKDLALEAQMVLHDQELAGKVCRHGMDIFCSQAGDLVWRNKDPALEAQARASYESVSSSETRKVPVTAVVSGSIGQV